ncbi:MAG: signal peptidase II [Candidatus Sumerlaeia bacterium]|nr:signal peptidase II [Candidatus Sumerlaeia bacterium]
MPRRNRPKTPPPPTLPTDPEVQPPETSAEQAPAFAGSWQGWPVALGFVALLVLVDQVTKWISVLALAPPPDGAGKTIVLIPSVFQLRYAENTGAAFSIFTGKVNFLAIVSLIASGFLVWWWRKVPPSERWGRGALVVILGGAIGNLIDRVRLGYVIDMFDAFIGSYDYPVFNVADSLICVGVAVLLVRAWKGKV